jgi:D-alanyl-D-alanine carboxypeptidase
MINGSSVLAFNPVTSKTYYERNIDQQRSIASITKLISSLVALDVYEPDQVITVSKAIAISDRSLNLMVGDRIRVSELLEAMLISSKNDAAELLAQEYEGGYTEFINLMNEKASFLGMESSHFSNPSGFYDKDNYSTAADLRILAIAAIKSDRILELVQKSGGTFEYERLGITKTVPLIPTNELIGREDNVVGLKTGYTLKSGQSFVGYFVSSGEDQLITIVLNSTDRFEETSQLLDLIQSSFSY